MIKGYNEATADHKIQFDEWGPTLSGYAPIRDRQGKAVAVLGVDITAEDLAKLQRGVHVRAIFVLVLGIFISFILGMLISERVTRPIERLVEGTHYISGGNLNYQVDIRGSDEITELANSFNQMAKSLHSSREKLLDYFYRVVQSLIRILEARDCYTSGHSERVSEYAQKIASKMEFAQDKIESLSKIALLHDIGKLGIQESILNKPGKLTEQEWEEIRKHPVIGEEILKPVLLNEEMLSIVRGHHERYDGKGYPDKISGDNINIFAAILSVADAYDAMTSHRAYRTALDKQTALEEIKRNRSAQFNPKAVDALLLVLQDEDKLERKVRETRAS